MEDNLLDLKPRRVLPLALSLMEDSPVLLLEGPRAVGKSTLLRQVTKESQGRLVDLDEPTTRDAALTDPKLLISGEQTVCIDEYQKAPVILDAIKAELNRTSKPGRFVLTGSARHDALPPAAQALTGRLTMLRVFPLSQGEIDGTHENFLTEVLQNPERGVSAGVSSTDRTDYISRICRGGFPLALSARSEAVRRRWIDDYVQLTLERDVRELSRLRQAQKLGLLLARLASQTAQILNVVKACEAVGLDRTTAESYVTLLEKVFLVFRLEAWGKTLTARSSAHPKIHVSDTGIAARLLRLSPERLSKLEPTSFTQLGHLVETFAVGELMKQSSWNDIVAGTGHWRTHDGDEVDFVVERDDGGVIGFEIKAGSRVSGNDMKGLRKLRGALDERFVGGFLLNLGDRSFNYEDRIFVAPLDRLWTTIV